MRMQKPGRSASKSSRRPDAGARAASTVRAVSLTVGIGSESTKTVTKDQRVLRGNTGVTTRPKLGETARVRSNHISAANDKGFLRVAGFTTSQDVPRKTGKTRIRNQQVHGSNPCAGSRDSTTGDDSLRSRDSSWGGAGAGQRAFQPATRGHVLRVLLQQVARSWRRRRTRPAR